MVIIYVQERKHNHGMNVVKYPSIVKNIHLKHAHAMLPNKVCVIVVCMMYDVCMYVCMYV